MIRLTPIFLSCSLVALVPAAQAKIEFNRDVRPILSDTCFHCHGPDLAERKGKLRLDIREEALKPAKSGSLAIVPGKPEESELITRVFTTDDDDLMPPTKLHKPLSKAQQETLRQWIAEGAEYQGHWAFIAPTTPPVPKLEDPAHAARVVNPIDAFVLAKLEKEKLQPSPGADKATLIRRVTLDLTGLPPTVAEVDAFLKDIEPQAYERVVDRLLKSEQYGEQMARQWLDFARYADSHGFQTDSSRQMWPWRDWVIRAFNSNLPFDQFTVQQIAGDLLPNPTRDQLVATGFNRNHRLNGEGGIIDEEWRIENNIDRVETTGSTWLALTFNCCRCHDHKFDPITQKDFYSMFAFFNNVPERGTIQGASNRSGGNAPPIVDVPTPEQEIRLAQLKATVTATSDQVAVAAKSLPQLVAQWEAKAMEESTAAASMWHPLEPETVQSQGGANLTRQPDGSYLASGTNPAKDVYVISLKTGDAPVTGFLLECFPDVSLPNQSLGRAPNGNFVLGGFDVDVTSAETGGNPVQAKLVKAVADFSQKDWDIGQLAMAKKKRQLGKGWAVEGHKKKEPRRAMFVIDQPIAAGAKVTITLSHNALNSHNIGRFRISASTLPATALNVGGTSEMASVKLVLETPAAKRIPEQKATLEKYVRTSVDHPLRQADRALAAAQKELAEFEKQLPNVMVMQEMPQPRDAFVLERGEYDKPRAKVGMATPGFLPPLPAGAPLNRLGLARWIVDPSNPLTSRVWVNRSWEKFFGYGLCKTTEDLGSQSEWPSNPELLDWLATEFMRLKWDMKAMQKVMVMSSTYRQSSKQTRELIEKDPDNRLLARGPRFRLGGEVIRDQALAVAGLLVPRVGGPSVKPYMPEGVWDETSKYGDLRGYKEDTGDGLYRRSLYTIWKRTAAPPSMLLFDAPSREICSVKRSRTNTPLQALALLNEVTFVEASRGLATQMMKQGTTPEERIRYGYERATAREIDAPALQTLLKGWRDRLAYFKAHPEDAAGLLSQGASKPDAALDAAELAAYTTTATVLLNLDRVVTRD
jgi:hypothetical protein